ncbi:MAG TPA: ABC-F family ATP-binding cassette domain-containing protein [bacterium]|nr:ABC-F family ATP-binding cassette domain-containing protein [bacterium]
MLQIRNLSYHIGERALLKEINWVINPGKRVALIGPNGAGKTTLLRIIKGDLEPHDGVMIKPKEYTIGYLPQEEIAVGSGPILAAVLEGHGEILRLEEQIAELHAILNTHTEDDEKLLERLGALESRYDALGGYTIENQAKAILTGLGFGEIDYQRPMSEFSGGWRMRVYLARLLLLNPDLLLLDEPTNHLDLPSLEWLESYLLSFAGSMVLVSHDRFFIDRLAQEITELDRGVLTHYSGNYHLYEKQKAESEELLLKQWEAMRDERERQQKFINRFRYKATKAAAVQSRIKMLEKMAEVELPPPPPPRIHFRLRVAGTSYKDVLHIEKLNFRYAGPWVLQDLNLDVYRGQKVALVGVNGAGKTTLTRLIYGELQPESGSIKIGERTTIGYYAQHQVDSLSLDATAYAEVASTTAQSLAPRIRDILGLFQFHGDAVFKPIRVLSGGEKARVSLAKILLSPVNFLIMDEPTNHLDTGAKEALEEALRDYDGTLLLIAHDRYFLDKLVTRVIELREGRLTMYEGNYSDYIAKREADAARAAEAARSAQAHLTEAAAETPTPARKSKEQKRQEAEARQAISRDRNRLEQTIARIEAEIQAREEKKSTLEAQLANPQSYKNGEFAAQLTRDYTLVKSELEWLVTEWSENQQALEQLLDTLV